MWSELQERIEENEQDRPVPLRRALFDVIRGSGRCQGVVTLTAGIADGTL